MRGTHFAELSGFVAVAEQKSFTRAAKLLGISTATLSQSISSLEKRLNVRLLNRTTRSVGLTAVGERLLGRLKPVLHDYETALESVNDFRDVPCGVLRLTVPPPAAESLLAPVLARFLETYPDIRVEISADPALRDIVAERFDAGIRFGQRVERDMVAVRISEDMRQFVVASPGYLARHAAPEKPQDLRAHNCIRLSFPNGAIFPWAFQKKGKRMEVAVEGSAILDDPVLAMRLAADGIGVLYLLESYLAPYLAAGKLVPILEDWMPPPDAYYLYYPSRRQNPAALQVLIDFFKANLKTSDSRTQKSSHHVRAPA
jgi:DNA-binding transcriptional LysR family regulator